MRRLQTALRIASQYQVSVYAISGGRNWGLGSAAAPVADCIALDLRAFPGRLHELMKLAGTATVDPAVTFEQVAAKHSPSSNYYMPCIGGPGSASLIGNLVSRGDGVGPGGNRARHCSNLEVVTPRGDRLRSGFGETSASKVRHLVPDGLGPELHSLFLQSDLGVVTEATFHLQPRPHEFPDCRVHTA